eukprot:m.334270 g.334270  ORF g.334270 m.334270 type:complete len:371 (+) comp17323_c0_seq1:159-1271(+)
MMVLMVLAFISIAQALPTARVGQNTSCRTITDPDNGALIDLNVLTSAGTAELLDYQVTSGKFPEYEYVFNVCGDLKYKDDVCVEGSTVCDRSASKLTTVNVYGNDEDTVVAYTEYSQNQSKSVLTLLYTAGQCYYRPNKNTQAKIYFFCDATAFEPTITLLYEDYLECEVQINFATIAACGTEKLKFSCSESGACLPSATGTMSISECRSQCSAPPPSPPAPNPAPPSPPSPPESKYSCNPGVNPGMCYESTGGEYDDLESCEGSCKFIAHTYSCETGKGCVVDANGKFKSQAECLADCDGPHGDKYSCKDETCEIDPMGKFASKEMCESACKAPDTYRCENDKCVEAAGGVSKELCESACVPSANPIYQ